MNQETTAYWQQVETVADTVLGQQELSQLRVPGLTILAHPQADRIGERSALTALASGKDVPLSRLQPAFAAPGDGRRRPLADPYLSRRPLRLVPGSGGAVRLLAAGSKTRVAADGSPVETVREFSAAELERGVVLLLRDRVALLLHNLDPAPPRDPPRFGAVGENDSTSRRSPSAAARSRISLTRCHRCGVIPLLA